MTLSELTRREREKNLLRFEELVRQGVVPYDAQRESGAYTTDAYVTLRRLAREGVYRQPRMYTDAEVVELCSQHSETEVALMTGMSQPSVHTARSRVEITRREDCIYEYEEPDPASLIHIPSGNQYPGFWLDAEGAKRLALIRIYHKIHAAPAALKELAGVIK